MHAISQGKASAARLAVLPSSEKVKIVNLQFSIPRGGGSGDKDEKRRLAKNKVQSLLSTVSENRRH